MRRYRAPFVRLNAGTGIWTIVDRHVTPERWQCSDLDRHRLFPFMCVPGTVANRAYSACEYLLARAAHTCRLSGATLAVFTIPHPSQLTASGRARLAAASGRPEECDARLPDLRLGACCVALGLPFVSGQDHLTRSDYKRREGIHWNARGHRRVAMVLRELAVRISAATSAERQSALASHAGRPIAIAPSQWASGGTGSSVR
jgi:hypothetical protein